MVTTFAINLPTFVNPHLFWVMDKCSLHILQDLQTQIQRECITKNSSVENNFEVGDIVAVCKNDICYRATIDEIVGEDDNPSRSKYLCWLIDYGRLVETIVVYKLSSKLKKIPSVAKQASLNNVVYVQQELTYSGDSSAKIINKSTINAPFGSYDVPNSIISNSRILHFKIEEELDGILLGDILYEENSVTKSLTEVLINQHFLIIDNGLFPEVKKNLPNSKGEHMALIYQICKKREMNKSSMPTISHKYLAELEEKDIFEEDLNRTHMNISNRKINITTSDNDSLSHLSGSETCPKDNLVSEEKSTTSSGIKVNRSQILLNRYRKQKQYQEEDSFVQLNSSLSSNEEITKMSPKTKLLEHLKKVRSTQQSDTESNNSSNTPVLKQSSKKPVAILEESPKNYNKFESTRKVATSIPHNTIIMPAGANVSHHVQKMAKGKEKQTIENKLDDSASDTSYLVSENVDTKSSPSEKGSTKTSDSLSNECEQPVNTLQVKPHCSCAQCDHWSTEKDWKVDTQFCAKRRKTLKKFKLPPLLKPKDSSEENITEVESLDYSSMSKIEKQRTYKLLVHGEAIPQPIRNISDALFHKDINKSLISLEYAQSKRLQAYAWPAIRRLYHACLIGGPKSGKSLAYLPLICSFLLEKNDRYHQLPRTGGPIAVILCKNSSICEDIYDLIRRLLGTNKLRVSLLTYPFAHINMSTIDILVTLPRVLIDLLKCNAVNMKRLCHIVIDNADVILKKHSVVIDKVFDVIQEMLTHRVVLNKVQVILCAEHWNMRIEEFCRSLNETPFICIGNQLEAALYGRMDFKMQFLNSACKEMEIRNLLKDRHHIFKTIVVCDDNEIQDLDTILMLKGIESLAISSNKKQEEMLFLEGQWESEEHGKYKVLICSDFVLNTVLTIRNASILIHYSLPKTWSQFIKRFSCFLENSKSPFTKNNEKIKCESHLFTDEKCIEQIPKLLYFLNTVEINLPDVLHTYYKENKINLENAKINKKISLCTTLRLFGSCSDEACRARHKLHNDLDVDEFLPKSGTVKFKILEIPDVTSYAVKLLSHIDLDGNIRVFPKQDITENLTEVLTVSKKQTKKPNLLHIYAYYDIDNTNNFYRCEVLCIDGDFTEIKLIDTGKILRNVNTSRLYKLPETFCDIPRQAVDVYVANYIPPYQDESYSARSYFQFMKLLEKHDYENIELTGQISLKLQNTLWLKNICEEIKVDEIKVYKFNLTRDLLNSKLVEQNNCQLSKLYELCKEAEIDLPKYESKKTEAVRKDVKQVLPQWAFLDYDKPNEVIFSAGVSPDDFYVRHYKFNTLLYQLQKTINEALKRPGYHRDFTVNEGMCYLTTDPDGGYSRVLVLKTEETKALCFFVDFGDEVVVNFSDLKYLSNEFITMLPFQAIQCSLYGIQQVEGEWQKEAMDVLYNYSTEPESDIFRSLYVKCCAKESARLAGQNKYSVLLKDGFGDKLILINNVLIDCGLAVTVEDQIIEDFDLNLQNDKCQSDEDTNNILDIIRTTEVVQDNVINGGRNVEHNIDTIGTVDGFEVDYIDDFEFCFNDACEFFDKLMKEEENPIVDKPPPKRELLPIQAGSSEGPLDYFTPTICWSQTENFIKINVELAVSNQYTVNVTKGRMFNFKATVQERPYGVKLMLFERVQATVQHTCVGPQVRIVLNKIKQELWPRLIVSKERHINIRYDLSTINVDEPKKKILELPEFLDESLSDEDMMYHVVSDRDSEFGEDLEFSD